MKGIIFDLDGTLLDSMEYWAGVAGEYLKTKNVDIDDETIKVIEEQPIYKSAEYIKEKFGFTESSEDIAKEIYSIMFYNYKKYVELKEGVLSFLEKARQKDIKLCVATATDRTYAITALERLGIWDMFEFLLSCKDVGSGKNESALIYEEAMKMLGTTKDETVIFEDAYHAVKTAKSAGFYVVGIYDNYFKRYKEEIENLADKFIYSFNEIEI